MKKKKITELAFQYSEVQLECQNISTTNNFLKRFIVRFDGTYNRFLFTIVCLFMLSFYSGAQLTTINVGTTTRSMFVYAPSGLQQNRPLVISMHGLNQDINYQKGQAKWELVADTAKFVVVYPAGINNSWDLSGNRDTDFILKIIDEMSTRYGIDRTRVYLSGFSMGGMMTYVAATKIADKIAAFAPVSGYPLGGASNFNSSRPIPIIHVHGDADDVVVYNQSLLNYLQGWRTRNGCPSTAVVTKPYPANVSNSIATKSYWGTCDCGTEFVLMTLKGKGHWHSNDVTFNTTNEIWKFVRKYTTSCGGTNTPIVSLTAPTNNAVYTEGDNVTINATATITTGSISKVDFYNGTTLLGTDATSPYTYTWNAVTAGVYAITAKATSAANAATTSTAIKIQVAKPIYQTGSVPTIDGTIDALWSNFTSVSVAKNNSGTISSTSDLSGNWKAMWDATNLYVLVQVTDDVKRNDAGTDVYNDDGVEVYIDMGNTKATTYGTNDQQYTFRWNDATAAYEINGHSVTGITKGITNTATGYIVEVRIPWSTMGGTATLNSFQGFEVMISDDDDGTARDGKLAWSATTDDTWSNPSVMGTVVLKGLNCTAPTAAITTSTPTTICAGSSVILNANTGTGYTYVWKNGTTTIAGAAGANYTATAAGSYTVVITNAGGCSATSAATTVVVNALPTIAQYTQIDGGAWNQTATGTVCAGSTIVLGPQPTVAAGWTWTGPNGYSATTREITLTGLTASQGGVYTASYTDGNTCKATSTFTLTVNALPTAAITSTTPTAFCTGGSVVLTASAGSSYVWKNGGTQVGTNQSYIATTAGSYTVEVTNASNCKTTSAATTVTVNSLPITTIIANGPTTIPQGGDVVLTASAGTSYKWYRGTAQVGTAQSYTATTAGSYTVEVTSTGNCSSISTATIVTIITANQPSLITITSPAANATVTTGAIDIAVDVTDADGSIVLVEFLDGNTVVGTSATAPYVFTWNNPSEGSHTITVRVTDSNGGITTSAPKVITSTTISTGVQSSNTLNAVVYPNPSNGILYIDTDVDLSDASFMILDVLGRELFIYSKVTGRGAMIDIGNLNEGAYVIIVKKENLIMRNNIMLIR